MRLRHSGRGQRRAWAFFSLIIGIFIKEVCERKSLASDLGKHFFSKLFLAPAADSLKKFLQMNQDNISGSSSETNIPPETAPGSQSYVYPAVQPWALVPAWALNSQQPTTFMAPVPANTTLIKSMDPYFMHVLKQHPVVQAEVQDQAASTENTGIGNTENESEGKEETSSGSTHVNDGMPKVFSQTSYQLSRNEPGHFSVDFCEHEELMSDRASTLRGCFNGIPTELKAKFKKELIEGNLPFELQNRVRQNVLQKIKSMVSTPFRNWI